MRLLNTSTLELSTFHGQVPPYAILSHTWDANEPEPRSFLPRTRWPRRLARLLRKRFHKVVGACNLARSKGYDFIWIDTCCIDKSSSAELSEAINSMFGWYQRAAICFAFLVDVRRPTRSTSAIASEVTLTDDLVATLWSAKWFTRGWTLQELIAPADLEFYDADWAFIGSKASLAPVLEQITGIPTGMFASAWQSLCAGGFAQQSLQLASVAQRMSWAAHRETTRPEDMAYCLMGLFDVNMPLLYGEGAVKAFSRLQTEVARQTNDQSLFTWGAWYNPAGCEKLLCYSLLAEHPRCFAHSGEVRATNRFTCNALDWTTPFTTTNDGYLRIGMRVCRDKERDPSGFMDSDHIAFLDCDLRGYPDLVVGIYVRRVEDVAGVKRFIRLDRLLDTFPRKLAAACEREDVLLGALPRHMPRVNFLGARDPGTGNARGAEVHPGAAML